MSALEDIQWTPQIGILKWPEKAVRALIAWLSDEYVNRANMIGGVDNVFLLVNEVAPDFNPVCAAVYTFERKILLKDLETAALNMAEEFPKYRSRLTSLGKKLHSPSFEPDPMFDIKTHVALTRLPHPAGKKELEHLMGTFIAKKWDMRRPLWEMLLVQNYNDDDGAQCALLSRAHHTLADGQGFVLSQYSMTSYFDEVQRSFNGAAKKLEAAKRGRLPPSQIYPRLAFLDPLTSVPLVSIFIQLSMMAFFWTFTIITGIISFFWSTYGGIRQGFFYLWTFWRVKTLTAYYKGPRVREREFASTSVFSISDVKLCQRAFSGSKPGATVNKFHTTNRTGPKKKDPKHLTLNDIVCAVMVDVAESVLQDNDRMESRPSWIDWVLTLPKRTFPQPIGFFIPISLRQPGDWTLYNQSTGSVVYLKPSENPSSSDISVKGIHKHLHRCRRKLSYVKHSCWTRIVFELLQVMGQVPVAWPIPFAVLPRLLSDSVSCFVRNWLTTPLVRMLLESVPILFTNVPGSTTPLKICGSQVIKWCGLPPQTGKGTLGVGVISYNGGLCVSVAADSVPGSQGIARELCDRFEKRFQVYVKRAREVVQDRSSSP